MFTNHDKTVALLVDRWTHTLFTQFTAARSARCMRQSRRALHRTAAMAEEHRSLPMEPCTLLLLLVCYFPLFEESQSAIFYEIRDRLQRNYKNTTKTALVWRDLHWEYLGSYPENMEVNRNTFAVATERFPRIVAGSLSTSTKPKQAPVIDPH